MNYQDSENITFRDLILKLKSYVDELKSKAKWIILSGILVAIILSIRARISPAVYYERLTFMMDEGQGSQGDMYRNLELIGDIFGGKSAENNLGKIVKLFESKKIIHNTLFDSIAINGKPDVLANHYLNLYGLKNLISEYKYFNQIGWKQKWPKNLLGEDEFRFKDSKIDSFDSKENRILDVIYESIAGNPDANLDPKLNSELDEESGIMTLTATTHHEGLTLGILNNVYRELSAFFIEKSIEKQQKTYDIIEFKRDSILSELKSAEYALANFKNSNRNLIAINGHLQQIRLEREVNILNIMYAEVVKQFEYTDFSLRNKTPVVQLIDAPRKPIIARKKSWTKAFAYGFLYGAFLMMFIILLRFLFRDLLDE